MKTKRKHWAVLTASTLGLTGLTFASGFGNEKYTYDAAGNIIEKLINGEVTKMAYDASNKVTSITSASKGSEQISYDTAGRPDSYMASDDSSRQLNHGYADKVLQTESSSGTAEFFYNAEGQMVGKSVDGELTPYTWDGNVMAAQGAEAFTNEAHVTGGVPVVAGDQGVIVSDYLGSTLSQGNAQFSSTGYGEGLENGRFTGKPFLQELGGYMFLHRTYSPYANQWTLSDPSGFPDGRNNRLYVIGDPLSQIDPSGLETVDYNTVLAKYNNSTPNCEIKVKTTSAFEVVPQAVSAEIVALSGTSGYGYVSPGGVTSSIGECQYKGTNPDATRYKFGLTVTAIATPDGNQTTHLYLSGSADGIDLLGADTKTSWAYEQ